MRHVGQIEHELRDAQAVPLGPDRFLEAIRLRGDVVDDDYRCGILIVPAGPALVELVRAAFVDRRLDGRPPTAPEDPAPTRCGCRRRMTRPRNLRRGLPV